ncbi:tRNA-modifying protein YgfZ [Pantoea sp. Nvir]|uniref:tRNA-modifying protein YgfZ n=1 Tax=Pantoea sp. Nvir TaxID=2576760 RepID=UPI0013587E09|nr:tRNA-modifying protein YgfZ [Pantoea sp. Nvir]MXP66747.1 tRNA-modifying protein YgfZ [Pantoea sp. Nvir]CAJ0990949.1 tRNA-modifying protein YgfZ [Pantoea sp. Nvir]
MPIFNLPSRPPMAASLLPLTLMSLNDWALVSVKGPDSMAYLQGQLTLDVIELSADQHKLAAHCNSNGKMWSTIRLFHRGDGYSYLLRRKLREIQLTQLKKYAVFSKVTLTPDDEAVLLGVAGFQTGAALSSFFEILPNNNTPVVQQEDSTLLWFPKPSERFLIITNETQAQALKQHLDCAQLNNSIQWLALDIEAGIPVIELETSAQLIPQAASLQELDAISFKKGCYTGQEMVARAKFRGTNKRALYWLAGHANRLPAPSDSLEIQIGERWRCTGTVLASIQLENGTIWVQAVMKNDLESNSVLRVEGDDGGHLNIQPLHYLLED